MAKEESTAVLQGYCFLGTFLYAGSAINACLLVNVGHIVHGYGLGGTYIDTGPATNTFSFVDYCYHCHYLQGTGPGRENLGYKCFVGILSAVGRSPP